MKGFEKVREWLAEVEALRGTTREDCLCQAAMDGSVVDVERLLGEGADINGLDVLGDTTPLCAAVEHGHPGVAEHLLKRGADPNRRLPSGITALHVAVDSAIEEAIHIFHTERRVVGPRTDLIAILLAHGSDRSARDNKGQTAADWARRGPKAEEALLPLLE